MKIKADFPLTKESIEEFCRVLIPEALEIELEVKFGEGVEELELELKTVERYLKIKQKNHQEYISDQKIVMIKVGLLEMYGYKLPWGGLIGVRPSKIVIRLFKHGLKREAVEEIFKELYQVSEKKTKLLVDVVERELPHLNRDHVNMYIGFPFCPTRCSYCSFAAYELGGPVGKFYDGVVETTLKEVELAGELFGKAGKSSKKLESIYIGGGTPSTLNETDMERLFQSIYKNLDLSSLKEFTFEAGREDSLTIKKLELMKEWGVTRISLNPQTFNEKTLKTVNRSFNKASFDSLYKKAKELGLVINMDLILGLPEEGVEEILFTLDNVKEYDIENLTIHVLALKKSSKLYRINYEHQDIDTQKIQRAIEKLTKSMGMKPYYMYRQKNSPHWGENIGYTTEGNESLFNMEMIEENQSTFALGAGGITKHIREIQDFRDDITMINSPKDPALYIKEMEERFLKKKNIFL